MIVSSYNSIYNFTLSFQISRSYTQAQLPDQESEPAPVAEPNPPQAIEPEGFPQESTGAVQSEGEVEEQKLRGENGVLRLLQEDHFKGNADMRLREIFNQELTILGIATSPEQAEDPGSGGESNPPEELD